MKPTKEEAASVLCALMNDDSQEAHTRISATAELATLMGFYPEQGEFVEHGEQLERLAEAARPVLYEYVKIIKGSNLPTPGVDPVEIARNLGRILDELGYGP